MVNFVVGLDAFVPVLDNRFVHFFDAGKRPVFIPDDVGVVEMGIGNEIERHDENIPFCFF